MLIRQSGAFAGGHTRLASTGGLEFGILRLEQGQEHRESSELETACLLLAGEALFAWGRRSARARRDSLVEEAPTVLHLPARAAATIAGGDGGAELAVVRIANSREFPPA